MKSRAIPCLLTLVFALGLAASVVAHAHAQANASVQIDTLSIVGTTLTIKGKNFGSAPAVFVGDAQLVIAQNSETEIVADTPQLNTGVHLVKVVRDSNEGGSSVSTLMIP